jgi:hypothetical protein
MWTLSKITPYILTLLGGIFLAIIFPKSNRKIGWLKYLIWILPFGIYFALNPIYEGDFSNNYRTEKSTPLTANLHPNELFVITIPGCPYCFESIAMLKKMKQRNPKLKINFLVCSKDKNSLIPYAKEIDHSFETTITNEPEKWAKLVHNKFPSYVRLKNRKLQIWSNDSFGCMAKDEVEKGL